MNRGVWVRTVQWKRTTHSSVDKMTDFNLLRLLIFLKVTDAINMQYWIRCSLEFKCRDNSCYYEKCSCFTGRWNALISGAITLHLNGQERENENHKLSSDLTPAKILLKSTNFNIFLLNTALRLVSSWELYYNWNYRALENGDTQVK